ncbi:MAG: AAA family ATPase [Clostridia bacterium]
MKKNYILAIAGGTCSGKSYLSDYLNFKLSNDFDVVVFHMDAYFRKPFSTTIAPITGIEYVEHNHPDVMEIDKLMKDVNKALDEKHDLIIIEGLFALHLAEIRNKSNLKVFVDLASDERLVRRITRHMSRGDTYEEVTSRYIDTVRFRHAELVEPTRWHADLVVNGTIEANNGKDVLTSYLENILSD